MAVVNINHVNIAYEINGEINNPVILLIQGLSTPLTGWPTPIVNAMVNAGYCVVRLDNRDMGQSQQMDHLSMPNYLWLMVKNKLGLRLNVPYQLDEMADDVIALMDYLKINKAHLVGVSMGGMIAQIMAINYPERLSSLCSIMSTTGNPNIPKANKKTLQSLAGRPISSDLEDRIDFQMQKWRVLGSPDYPSSEKYLRELVIAMLDRGISARGTVRQIYAIMAAKDREADLAKIDIPTLVIHGVNDPLIKVEGGKATAKVIPKAKLELIEGMGHELPEALNVKMAELIINHVNSVSGEGD